MPAVWKVMAGCSSQTLALNPTDLDGDVIKCRWATADEGKGRVLIFTKKIYQNLANFFIQQKVFIAIKVAIIGKIISIESFSFWTKKFYQIILFLTNDFWPNILFLIKISCFGNRF